MATQFNLVQSYAEAVAEKVHNLGSDQLKVALTNTAHTASWTKLSDLTQIDYTNITNGTTTGRNLTTSSSAQTSGVYKLVIADLTLVASGTVPTFRYIYIYNDTATNDELIGYFDYGSAIDLLTGNSLILDFDATNGLLTHTIA